MVRVFFSKNPRHLFILLLSCPVNVDCKQLLSPLYVCEDGCLRYMCSTPSFDSFRVTDMHFACQNYFIFNQALVRHTVDPISAWRIDRTRSLWWSSASRFPWPRRWPATCTRSSSASSGSRGGSGRDQTRPGKQKISRKVNPVGNELSRKPVSPSRCLETCLYNQLALPWIADLKANDEWESLNKLRSRLRWYIFVREKNLRCTIRYPLLSP